MSPAPLWNPTDALRRECNLSRYMEWLSENKNLYFADYADLWKWSVDDVSSFWASLWEYFNIIYDGSYEHVVTGQMPECRWFDGTSISYAEHVFRNYDPAATAIVAGTEGGEVNRISWKSLRDQTSAVNKALRDNGVVVGDAVAAYLPCIPEATVSLLATNAIGAIWSSCSPDFGTAAVIDRFAQIKPKVLIAVSEYRYGGKRFSKSEVLRDLVKAIPSIRVVIVIGEDATFEGVQIIRWKDLAATDEPLKFTRVPFNHPIWVLYSSGTTGLPKAITHSCGGILLETLKYCTFHNDFRARENCFWYTTTGWMMWNYIHGALLTGSTMVIYDGSPAYPSLDVLWQFAADTGIAHFGTSAGFILACMKEGISPMKHDLSGLRSIGSTGSTLPPEGFGWVYEHVKRDVWLASMSGGTDVCSAFVGGNPMWPVYQGEIQCRALGASLYAFDEAGNELIDDEGEMVITKPMPSMPIYFWDDTNFARYRESYFEMFPGVWRHGDWIRITSRQGIIIYGRSDATLNRGGVRIGTSEIYRAVDQIAEVKDSVVVCIERPGGDFWMPLFVVMKQGHSLDDDLRKKINTAIRSAYSPRHVPDEIIAVADIPYTISGKKTEMPVKKVLMGKDPGKVANPGSLRNPESLEAFRSFIRD